MQRNIILIGFMGTGKSTIGRNLSQVLGYPVMDTDEAIEQQEGCSIPEIFATRGEAAFRDLETALLASLHKHTGYIISTGGGIVGQPENRDLLKNLGYVVWLTADAEEIYRRTSRNSNRPLLNNDDPRKTIRELLDQRTPWYQETAHLTIETDTLNFNEVTTGIVESAQYHFSCCG